MSLVRFGQEDSDVYVYPGEEGWICCGCHLDRRGPYSDAELIQHLNDHRESGDKVPEFCFNILREENDSEDRKK